MKLVCITKSLSEGSFYQVHPVGEWLELSKQFAFYMRIICMRGIIGALHSKIHIFVTLTQMKTRLRFEHYTIFPISEIRNWYEYKASIVSWMCWHW
jgi:hypothetical protein